MVDQETLLILNPCENWFWLNFWINFDILTHFLIDSLYVCAVSRLLIVGI